MRYFFLIIIAFIMIVGCNSFDIKEFVETTETRTNDIFSKYCKFIELATVEQLEKVFNEQPGTYSSATADDIIRLKKVMVMDTQSFQLYVKEIKNKVKE